ncbi:hypothetical protein MBLNU230_g6413t1 [Neophaeotheca triangularis]
MHSYILPIAALAGAATAKVCTNVTVPVNIDTRQAIFDEDLVGINSNIDATTFSLNFTEQGVNFTDVALTGYQTLQIPANISAKFCRPDNMNDTHNPTVQVLTHGIGFDKTYWDLPYDGFKYSYEDVAVDQYGFCTVAIDRYGINNSTHGDPYNEVQAPAEVSALYDLTMQLRNGQFPTVPHKFDKVVHIGHSFGSAQTYLLTALHPEASDGIILTGYSQNGTWLARTLAGWNLHIANLNQPLRFGDQSLNLELPGSQKYNTYRSWKMHAASFSRNLIKTAQYGLSLLGLDYSTDSIWQAIATTELGDLINGWNATALEPQAYPNAYLTWTDLTANIYAFLHPSNFDTGAAVFAESTKQPVTPGEIFTLANGYPPTNPFTGPVQVLTGERDNIYCGGDCLATGGGAYASIPAAVAAAFPDASDFEAYIQPTTGHGINFHYNATAAYEVMQEWFISHELGSS